MSESRFLVLPDGTRYLILREDGAYWYCDGGVNYSKANSFEVVPADEIFAREAEQIRKALRK